MPQAETAPVEQPVAKPDSQVKPDIQDGGITPQVGAVLAKLPEAEAKLIREDIAQRNAYLTRTRQGLEAQRQKLEADVQLAGVFREAMTDSEFKEYLDARSGGNLATYFRKKAGQYAPAEEHPVNGSNRPTSAAPSDNGGNGTAVQSADLELKRRVEAIEARANAAERERMIADFSGRHPDYTEYLPAMHSVRQRLPNAGLEDLYLIAKQMVSEGIATKATPAPAAQAASPPLPVGAAAGASSPALERARDVATAWQQAKTELGLEGPIRFQFD